MTSPDNPLEPLSDDDLLALRDRCADRILAVHGMPAEERFEQRPKGGGSPGTSVFLIAHFFAAADSVLRARGIE